MAITDMLEEERKMTEVTHIRRSRTKDGIMQEYWLEFLGWVKEFNVWARANTDDRYEKDASEINFWHWYIDAKMEGK